MSARNAARCRLDDSLNGWSTRWVLDGNAMHCAGCSADEQFRHVASCPQAGDFTQFPWHELAELLQQLPQVPE